MLRTTSWWRQRSQSPAQVRAQRSSTRNTLASWPCWKLAVKKFPRVSASIRLDSGVVEVDLLRPRGRGRQRRLERHAELAAQVARAEEHRRERRQLAGGRLVVGPVRVGRQQRDDHVDVVGVAERVERQLERLALEQQQPLGRRLAAGDRAVLAEPVELVHDAVALDQLDVAADRRGAQRDLERPLGQLHAARLDRDELVGVAEPVLDADVLGDLRARPASSSPPAGCHVLQPSGWARSEASSARITPSPTTANATPISAPTTKPKRER